MERWVEDRVSILLRVFWLVLPDDPDSIVARAAAHYSHRRFVLTLAHSPHRLVDRSPCFSNGATSSTRTDRRRRQNLRLGAGVLSADCRRFSDGSVVTARPAASTICGAIQMVSTGDANVSRGPDVCVRARQNVSVADAVPISGATAGTLWKLFADGRALVVDRSVAKV